MLELIQVSTSMACPYKQISISLGKKFLRISRIRNIPLTWILVRVFVYVPPFIFQILDFIYWTVLIFILIYFEWRDTENQQLGAGKVFEVVCWMREDETWRWNNKNMSFIIYWNCLLFASCRSCFFNCDDLFSIYFLRWLLGAHNDFFL